MLESIHSSIKGLSQIWTGWLHVFCGCFEGYLAFSCEILSLLLVWEWVDHKAGPRGRRGQRRWTVQGPSGKTVSISKTKPQGETSHSEGQSGLLLHGQSRREVLEALRSRHSWPHRGRLMEFTPSTADTCLSDASQMSVFSWPAWPLKSRADGRWRGAGHIQSDGILPSVWIAELHWKCQRL